jgi:hypothetical protein
MRVRSARPLTAVFSLLLCAASAPHALLPDGDPALLVEVRTSVHADGSGTLAVEVNLSKQIMALAKGFPGYSAEFFCGRFYAIVDESWKREETERDGALRCSAETPFARLDELESLTEAVLAGAEFERLEIGADRFYYELSPNLSGSSLLGAVETAASIECEAYWTVEAPGDVIRSNADRSSGRVKKWDMRNLTPSSRIRLESELGGYSPGPDPALIGFIIALSMFAGCGVPATAAGAAVFLLRKIPPPGERT